MDEGLEKSRRNLMAISLVLTLFDFAQVSIGEINLLGTNLIVGNPDVLRAFLWVLWAYLLVRYLQHLANQGDLGISKAFHETAAQIVNTGLSRQHTNAYWSISRDGFGWHLNATGYDPVTGSVTNVGKTTVPRRLMVHAYLVASIHIVVLRPFFTDHVMPLMLAVAALLFALLF